jgi:hypothetical protein
MIKYIIFCLFLASCNFSPKQVTEKKSDKVNITTVPQDTLVSYSIEGISAEGAESKVSYQKGNIVKSVTNIYGETGQASIVYKFEANRIKVLETKYYYKTEIENVKLDEDMQLDYEISYFIDFKGNIIGKEIPNRIDIFKEFKEVVPFKLK